MGVADRLRVDYDDVAGNGIGERGAVALARALESGRCQLMSLSLGGESRMFAYLCVAAAL